MNSINVLIEDEVDDITAEIKSDLLKGDKGEPFKYSDFTPEQLANLKGEKGDKGDTGAKGDKGEPFEYSDFTPEQLANLKGEKGDKGDTGAKGDKGEPFEYSDFTPEQLANLKGEKGDKGDTGAKGDKGEPFEYSDFTPEQLANLKGDKGELVELINEAEGKSISIESAPSKMREIKIEGETIQKTRSGRNIFNKNAKAVNNGVSKSVLDTGVRITQTIAGQYTFCGIEVGGSELLGKTLRTSANWTKSADNVPYIAVYFGNSSSMALYGLGGTGVSGQIQQITLPNVFPTVGEKACDTVYILLYSNRNGTGNVGDYVDYTDLIVTIDNEDMSYEDYGASPSPDYPSEIENLEGNIEIKDVGKNLFNIFDENWKIYYGTKQSDGSIKANIQNNYFVSLQNTSDYWKNYIMQNKGKTLTFSQKEEPTNFSMEIVIYGNRTSTTTGYQVVNGGIKRSVSITIADDFTSVSRIELKTIRKSSTFADTTTVISELQLEEGSTATSYTPYQEQVVTFPLSDGQKLMEGSYLASDGIHHKRKQVVLDGINNKFTSFSNIYNNRGFIVLSGAINSDYKAETACCSHFKYNINVYNDTTSDEIGFIAQKTVFYFRFTTSSEINALEKANNWLSEQYTNGTPVIVEYELAEEEIVPYTEEQQEAWNKIKNMILFKGTNYISCTGKVKIKYYTNEEMNEIYAYKEELHEHENKKILDQTQESFTTELKNKLEELNNYVLPTATSTTLGGVKAGSNTTIGDDGAINVNLDYNELSNKPKIAGIDLQGNKSLNDLGIQAKEEGKGLSTENYSSEEKTKLAGIETGANKYVHPTTSGNKHIPGGGSSGQVLKWQSDGTAKWDSLSSSGELGTQDLNTIKTSGIYIQSTSTNFLKSKNYPFDYAEGFPFFDILLEVLNVGTYIMQKLHITYKISVNGQDVSTYLTYMRFSTDGGTTWKNWRGHEGVNTSI